MAQVLGVYLYKFGVLHFSLLNFFFLFFFIFLLLFLLLLDWPQIT